MFCRMTLISFMKVQIHILSVNSPAQIELEGTVPLQLLVPWQGYHLIHLH